MGSKYYDTAQAYIPAGHPALLQEQQVTDTARFKILIADDEPDICEFMQYNLENEGYRVLTAANGREAVEVARHEVPDLIIMDIMMPHMNGIDACKLIRETPKLRNTLVIFLTARKEEYYQIAGFKVGADDFISKPINPRVMMSRIKALLRRVNGSEDGNTIRVGDLEINREKYLVYKNGQAIAFPRKEFELLSLLTSRPGKIFTREDILRAVWGKDIVVGDRTIDVHIRKIRMKLGDHAIKTAKGIGYKYEA